MTDMTRAGAGTTRFNSTTGLKSRGGQFTEAPRLEAEPSVQDQFTRPAGTTLGDARTLANELMTKHNVRDWNFEFDNAQNRMGQTNYQTRTITMSRHYVLAADTESITQTMLHEIAHVHVGQGHGHDAAWRRAGHAIGHTGGRTAESPHSLNRDAEALASAYAASKTVENVTSGPLQIGERVRTLTGKYTGVLVSVARVNATIFCDQTGDQVLIRFTSLYRPAAGSAAPSEAKVEAPAAAKPPAKKFRVDDHIYTISGRTGFITKVGRTRYHFKTADGETWTAPFSSCALV